ncbi:hypothetical protein BJ982_000826 [Sphaerisporangium siamense]|uniref:Uncharacterized protein n=1 Tax=Sphaerisporangium siamense TaxID=795645 RepID=A0A7W7D319_9ACTN|nr:hypothetical protein [Sphaerisporangium siamense]MBB4699282.1 hypothetical protein [Sphaerisporangium siamense]
MELLSITAAQAGVLGSVFAALVGTVVYGFRLVYVGRLVPRSTVDALTDSAEQRVKAAKEYAEQKAAEAAEYKAAWLASEKARHEQDVQIGELMESSRTTVAILRSIAPVPPGEARDVVAP